MLAELWTDDSVNRRYFTLNRLEKFNTCHKQLRAAVASSNIPAKEIYRSLLQMPAGILNEHAYLQPLPPSESEQITEINQSEIDQIKAERAVRRMNKPPIEYKSQIRLPRPPRPSRQEISTLPADERVIKLNIMVRRCRSEQVSRSRANLSHVLFLFQLGTLDFPDAGITAKHSALSAAPPVGVEDTRIPAHPMLQTCILTDSAVTVVQPLKGERVQLHPEWSQPSSYSSKKTQRTSVILLPVRETNDVNEDEKKIADSLQVYGSFDDLDSTISERVAEFSQQDLLSVVGKADPEEEQKEEAKCTNEEVEKIYPTFTRSVFKLKEHTVSVMRAISYSFVFVLFSDGFAGLTPTARDRLDGSYGSTSTQDHLQVSCREKL